jgi:hypothetical protein
LLWHELYLLLHGSEAPSACGAHVFPAQQLTRPP